MSKRYASRASRSPAVAFLASILLVACTHPATEIVVRVETTIGQSASGPAPTLDHVEIAVSANGMGWYDHVLPTAAQPLPQELGLVPRDGNALSHPVTVDVVGTIVGGGTVRQRAIATYTPQATVLLRVSLVSSCINVDCGDPNVTGETCIDGRCATVVQQSMLPEYTPDSFADASDIVPVDTGGTDASCDGASCTHVVQLAAGRGHACALLGSGDVYCWGQNDLGQLAESADAGGVTLCHDSNDAGVACAPTPVHIANLPPLSAIASGLWFLCGLSRTDGRILCWGDNSQNQLGMTTTEMCPSGTCSTTPIAVASVSGATGVSASVRYGCAIVDAGATCWGSTDCFQRGSLADTTQSDTPLPVIGVPTPVAQIGMGEYHACALVGGLNPPPLYCWGDNSLYELGRDAGSPPDDAGAATPFCNFGTFTGVPGPVEGLPAGDPVVEVAAEWGTDERTTCARLMSGAVWCWGSDDCDHLGRTSGCGTGTGPAIPGPVQGLPIVHALAGGTGFMCAAADDGTVRCWGSNFTSNLGVPSNPTGAVATVPNLTTSQRVQSVAAGYDFACAALEPSGEVWCWGNNNVGQLGIGAASGIEVPRRLPVFP